MELGAARGPILVRKQLSGLLPVTSVAGYKVMDLALTEGPL